ncbi:MAG: hypothetical protein ACT4QD_26605 [Acidobacteriota bacterium]
MNVTNSAWSPDSRFVAYWDGGDGFLKRLAIDTGAHTRVGQFRDMRGMAWGPQGIVFTDFDEGVGGLRMVGPDGGEFRRLSAPVRAPIVLP